MPSSNVYGTSETGMSTSNPLDAERKAGAVGKPLPGVLIKIVDDDGIDVVTDGVGEITGQRTKRFLRLLEPGRRKQGCFHGRWLFPHR